MDIKAIRLKYRRKGIDGESLGRETKEFVDGVMRTMKQSEGRDGPTVEASHRAQADIERYFADLLGKVRNGKEAEEVARGMGFSSVRGSREAVINKLKQSAVGRVGSYMRVFA